MSRPGFHPSKNSRAPTLSFSSSKRAQITNFVLRLWEHLQIFARLEVFHFKITRLQARCTRLNETLVPTFPHLFAKFQFFCFKYGLMDFQYAIVFHWVELFLLVASIVWILVWIQLHPMWMTTSGGAIAWRPWQLWISWFRIYSVKMVYFIFPSSKRKFSILYNTHNFNTHWLFISETVNIY